MSKKKKTTTKKKIKSSGEKQSVKKCNKVCTREKTYGDPTPVKPALSYKDGEIYPRLEFRPNSLWNRIKRFFGLVP